MSRPDRTSPGSSRPNDGPDLTDPIMQRLGFIRVSSPSARRQRLWRWGARLATVALLLTAIGIGLQMQGQTSSARRATSPTLPAAVRHDLLHHGTTINRAIRSIRNLSPDLGIQLPVDQPQLPVKDGQQSYEIGLLLPVSFPGA